MGDLCGYLMENGVPRGRVGGDQYRDKSKAPYLSPNWAAGQSFHRCHMERAVPVDLGLPWIFTGEEIDRAARLFTHGYDIYAPTQMIVLHEYAHAKQDFWNEAPPNKGEQAAHSRARLLSLLETGPATHENYGKFGLGTQRSLEDYVLWSKIDLGGKWGGILKKRFPGQSINWEAHNHCKHLLRPPIRDEAALLAEALAAHRDTDDLKTTNNGEVSIPGDLPDVHPIRVM